MSDRDYIETPHADVVRAMARCATCSHWWSVVGDKDGKVEQRCPCGGELRIVDMQSHYATLPHAPYDASKDPVRRKA